MSQAPPLLTRLILGTDAHMQRRLRLFFLSTGMYASCMGLNTYVAWIGVWQPWQAIFMACYLGLGHLASYLLMRSRASLEIPDATLMITQIGFAVSAAHLGYAMGGIARGGLLLIYGMHLMFAMLTLSPRQTLKTGLWTLGTLGAVSATMMVLQPQRFPWREELIFLGLAFGILPAMLAAALRVTRLRRDLEQRNERLQAATAKLQELAERDGLTGLFNRRHMVGLLDQEIRRSERSGEPITVILFDLDHFKQVNDTRGHAIGDRVLQSVAEAASRAVRTTDAVARWGGEEFLTLLTKAEPPIADIVMGRMRKTLDAKPPLPDAKVTFSAGVAQHVPGESADALLDRADRALYAAKHNGRDCRVVADPPASPEAAATDATDATGTPAATSGAAAPQAATQAVLQAASA